VPVWGSGFVIPIRDVVRFADPSIGSHSDPYGEQGFDPYERGSSWDPNTIRRLFARVTGRLPR